MIPRDGFDSTDPGCRTAVLIVAGEESVPDRAFEAIEKLFGAYFKQIIFISTGIVDYAMVDAPDFRASDVGSRAGQAARGRITACVDRARASGMTAVTCVAVGTDPAEEVEKLCAGFSKRIPSALFFLGKIVFERRRWYHGLLHADRSQEIQRRLERRGIPFAILPVVVPA